MPPMLEVRTLGPLEVSADGQPITIVGAMPRAILTKLGLHCSDEVSAEALIELLWEDDPPRTATIALRTHISTLRRSIGDHVQTRGTGWVLNNATTDAARFEASADAGRHAARTGDWHAAVTAFNEALDTWRGPPQLPDTRNANAEIARWTEHREALADERIDALLALGEAESLIVELETAVAQAPLRERRWTQLMLALYRAGRQADALAAYQRARTLLTEQHGIEPGPEMRELEKAMLTHNPDLAARGHPVPTPNDHQDVVGLPVQYTTFVGRQMELARVGALLGEGSLVTIVGPGGVGKTRLAVMAAVKSDHENVVFADLVPVSPTFVVRTVAAALGIAERPQQPLVDAVRDRLGSARWLLVLDNCEHVIGEVSDFVADILPYCPRVVVLATSRERLGAPSERLITVPPLATVSDETGEAKGSEAATLFLDRARAADPAFDADPDLIGEVCARLDGIPLAIELAAARCASLGIDGVTTALDDRMRLLSGARGTGRHRSLRTVLDWSHDLLDAEERATFRRVAVFAGGFDLTAVASVAHQHDGAPPSMAAVADLLGRLTDKNLLVHRDAGGRSSWRLLEIVRVYALERLADSGEELLTRGRHLRWAADVGQRLEHQVVAGQAWRTEFDAVVDDLRAALTRVTAPDETAYRLAQALGHLTYARSFLAEARYHYIEAAQHGSGRSAAEALAAAADVATAEMLPSIAFDLQMEAAEAAADTDASRSIALASAVILAGRYPGGFPEPPTQQRLDELLDRARRLADDSPLVTAYLAAAAAWAPCPVRAQCDGPLSERALEAARRSEDPVLLSVALDGITTVRLAERRFRAAARIVRERAGLLDRIARHDPHTGGEIVDLLYSDTEVSLAAGDPTAALAAARRASDSFFTSGVPRLRATRLVQPLALCGMFAEAKDTAAEMWAAWQRAGEQTALWTAPAASAIALVHGLLGEDQAYHRWSIHAHRLSAYPHVLGFAPFVECRVALHSGRVADAAGVARGLPVKYMGWFDAYARAIAAEAAVVAGLPDAPEQVAAVASLGAENDWANACLLRARGRLAGDPVQLERSVVGWERIGARFERACTLLLLNDRAGEGAAELKAIGCPLPGAAWATGAGCR